jgi:hypothetical protein
MTQHELMVNCITLYQVFKTAVTLYHMDMMMHVFRHSLQDIIFYVSNPKSDVVLQSVHGKKFIPVYSFHQAAPEKIIWRFQVWQSKRPQSMTRCSHNAVQLRPMQLQPVPLSPICSGHCKLLMRNASMKTQCF